MRFVDDQREPLARQLVDLSGDHRKLLQRGDDDGLAPLERIPELARGGVDVLHHPQRLLELAHGALQGAVEHASVGYDHDRVEDAAVVGVVQGRELVGEPGDGIALAAPGGVLDEILLPHPIFPGVGHEPAHAIELLVARKDQRLLPCLAAGLVLLLDFMDELAHQVEHAVARPGLFPEIGG